VEVKIYDVNGIKLKTYLIGIDTQQETLDLTDLYRGTYILSFTGSKGRIYKKILKI